MSDDIDETIGRHKPRTKKQEEELSKQLKKAILEADAKRTPEEREHIKKLSRKWQLKFEIEKWMDNF